LDEKIVSCDFGQNMDGNGFHNVYAQVVFFFRLALFPNIRLSD
jgi:hypothetical protein